MAKYAFLSDEWVSEAHKIRAEYQDRTPEIPIPVKMNLIVKDVPFGDGAVQAHLDTTAGHLDLDVGHLDGPDLTMTVDYVTARAILVDGDPQAVMTAFMGGRIKVDGDITKLLALQSAGIVGGADPLGGEIAERINAITE
ncbi:MAG: SCP2 sterol-binding domain-containing protein [Actinomycetota bacterium]|nr:SCP2 sterol-binding domain-containing protein [Actinomycetota bacterium]